jgi:hypothetical protein
VHKPSILALLIKTTDNEHARRKVPFRLESVVVNFALDGMCGMNYGFTFNFVVGTV